MNIFYSWQSDLPNATNRGFIEDALEKAVRAIRADDSIQVEPRIDRDTQDIAGSPDIAGTILEKIDKASIFVCDVSIINSGTDDPRKMPNPNVLFELGYAIKTMGSSRVILVQNTAFGGPELLPFDLKMKRVLSYNLAPQNEKAQARTGLQAVLERAIRMIIPQVEQENRDQKSVDRKILVKQLLSDPNSRVQLADLLQTTTNEVWETLQATSLFDYKIQVTQEEFLRRVEAAETLIQPLAEIFAEGCRWVQDEQAKPFVQALKKFTRLPAPQDSHFPVWEDLAYYPALILLYTAGISAVFGDNYQILRHLTKDISYRTRGEDYPLVEQLNPISVFNDGQVGKWLPGKERRYTPVSDHLLEKLRPLFLSTISDENEMQETFDRLEYLFSLIYAEYRIKQGPNRHFWVPFGSYLWRATNGDITKVVQAEVDRKNNRWGPWEAGLFDISPDEFNLLKKQTDEFIQQVRAHKGVFLR